jgi:hypothetical protein
MDTQRTPMDFLSRDALVSFTALGDPTFLLCAALGAFFYLWVSHRRRLAAYLALAVGLSVALTIGAKFGFLLAYSPDGSPRLRSPSGHVAIATTVYGCCVVMLTATSGAPVRAASIIGLVVFLLALAGTRLALQLHSILEIAVGFLIGLACLLVFAHGLRTDRGKFDAGRFAALLLLLAVTRFARVDAEEMIAYGARLAALLSRMSAAVERPAIVNAERYHFERLLSGTFERFPTLSKGATESTCGGRDVRPFNGGARAHCR